MTSTSLSKGYSAHKPDAKKRLSVLKPANSFQPLPGETRKEAERRFAAFEEYWRETKDKIEELIRKEHEHVLNDLVQFVVQSQVDYRAQGEQQQPPEPEKEEEEYMKFLPTIHPLREIPVGAILAGINMPDHKVLFERLREALVKKVSPFIVYLESRKCNAGIKATMREVLQQLMEIQDEGDSDDEDGPKTAKRRKVPNCTMPLLRSWYKDVMMERSESCPIVIIVDHFEAFTPAVLQELITVISGSVHCVPFVLVFGLATSTAAIHRCLTQATSSLLRIQQFTMQSSLVTVDEIVDKVLLGPDQPFSLGSNCYKFLMDHFLMSSLSVGDFVKGLYFAVMEHFTWSGVTTLCVTRTKLADEMKLLSKNQVDMLRALPSFRKYVQEQEAEVKLSLLEDDEFTKETIEEMLTELYNKKETLSSFMKVLLIFLLPLPTFPLGVKLHQLYLHCSDVNLVDTSEFKTIWPYIRVLGEKQLQQCLLAVVKCIEEMKSTSEDAFDFKQNIATFLDDLSKLTPAQKPQDTDNSSENKMAAPVTTSERKLLLEEHLKLAVSKSKPMSSFTSLRTKIMDYLFEVFQVAFSPSSSLPCYEVFHFSQEGWLKQHLNPPLRRVMQMALEHPEMYLPSCGSVDTNQALSRDLPDISIVYHLHLECGRMINLYDWMQAFISVVAPDEVTDTKQVDKELHERFMKAVSELQLLGLVKQTKRKTDHVQRLTWGIC